MPLTKWLADEINNLRREPSASGRSIRLAARAAKSALPVLIEGEPGTGAAALARAIHACGDRKDRPFICVHAGSLGDAAMPTLFGSNLLPGAKQIGKVAAANGGTLLLQQVEDLPAEAQKALLRLVQDPEIAPVGARRALRADIRIIATTAGAGLMERVRQGRFREDLYYRLHVLPITLAPLRARRDEIPALAQKFLDHFAAEEGKALNGISAAALALLVRYDWPGNLRQLENAIFRAVALADGKELTVAEFPQIAAQVDGFRVEIPPVRIPGPPAPVSEMGLIEMRDPDALALLDEDGEIRRLEDLEAEIIRFALIHYRGRMSAVSRRLGIGRSTLYRKLKDLGVENLPEDAAA